jgi:hypothetical protein
MTRLSDVVWVGVLAVGAVGAQPAMAASIRQQMLSLDLPERIEQRCNARVMGDISRADPALHPDELVAYAFTDIVMQGDVVQAKGAAVRSGNRWFRLSYVCKTTPDGLDIVRLSYDLGKPVPRDQWDDHQLVPQ